MPIEILRYTLASTNEQGQVVERTNSFVIPIPNNPTYNSDTIITVFRATFPLVNQHLFNNAPRTEDWIYTIKLGDQYLNVQTDEGRQAANEHLADPTQSEIFLDIRIPPADSNVFDAVNSNKKRRRDGGSPDSDDGSYDDDDVVIYRSPTRPRRLARTIRLRSTIPYTDNLDDATDYENDIPFNYCLTTLPTRSSRQYPMDYEIIRLDLLPKYLRTNYTALQVAIVYAELVEGTNETMKKWRSPWLGRAERNNFYEGSVRNVLQGLVQSGKTAAVIWIFFDIFRGMTPLLFVRNQGGDQHMARIISEFNAFFRVIHAYFEHGIDERFVAPNSPTSFEVSQAFNADTYQFVHGKMIKKNWNARIDLCAIFLDRYNKSQIGYAQQFVGKIKQFNRMSNGDNNISYSLILDEDDEGIVSTGGAAQIKSFKEPVPCFNDDREDDDQEDERPPTPAELLSLRSKASLFATITNLTSVGEHVQDGKEPVVPVVDNAPQCRCRLIQLPKNEVHMDYLEEILAESPAENCFTDILKNGAIVSS